ncbi:MAG: hypothetical protein LBF22_12815 [Deltaproteobacteria bacterium]|jgi:hypothetical protein|nr:hypothetical protein [Deltaproteobacteria bacterium]
MDAVIAVNFRFPNGVLDDDKRYVLDLGLLKVVNVIFQPTNPRYGDVIVRTLSSHYQNELPTDLINRWMDGHRLDMSSLLEEYQGFWRVNSGMLDDYPYHYNESIAISRLYCLFEKGF